jgi:hypothetical protein
MEATMNRPRGVRPLETPFAADCSKFRTVISTRPDLSSMGDQIALPLRTDKDEGRK